LKTKYIPKVSVVVPIYNVEKYLRQCLDSIVGQTLHDIEIILVNDGSTDSSPEIIQEYAEKDKRIIVVNQENGGLGKAYNVGIDAATSEYIGFVESDDFIEPDMYETLWQIAKTHNVDVAKSLFWIYNAETLQDDEIISGYNEPDMEQVINPRKCPQIFSFGASVWSAIYKRNFLNNKKIRFLESPGASYQDTSFAFKIWSMADSVYFTKKPLLHYRSGHETQSTKSKEKVFAVCDELREIERFMADYPELFTRLTRIYNYMKWNTFYYNLKRLEGKNHEIFSKTLANEFTADFFKNKQFESCNYSWRQIAKKQKFLNPNSVWFKLKYRLLVIASCFIKVKIKNGIKKWVILGYFPVWKNKVIWKSVE
jgi:glycosyltransferase involved in cell wall biosynthesis